MGATTSITSLPKRQRASATPSHVLGEPLEESRRQFLRARVDPDQDRIPDAANRREDAIDEMHGPLPPRLELTDSTPILESSTSQG